MYRGETRVEKAYSVEAVGSEWCGWACEGSWWIMRH